MRGVVAQPGPAGREFNEGGPVVDHSVTEPQVQRPQLLLGVRAEQHDGSAGGAGPVDGGPGKAEHHLGWQAVAQLGVHMIGPQDALGQLGPGVLRLVGHSGSTHHGDPVGGGRPQRLDDHGERLAPWRGHQLVAVQRPVPEGVAPEERADQAVLVVIGLEDEPFLVRQPAPVHGVGVHPLEPQHAVA